MKIDKVIYKRVLPDKRLEPTKVEQGTDVVLKRLTSSKPVMKRDSQDADTDQ